MRLAPRGCGPHRRFRTLFRTPPPAPASHAAARPPCPARLAPSRTHRPRGPAAPGLRPAGRRGPWGVPRQRRDRGQPDGWRGTRRGGPRQRPRAGRGARGGQPPPAADRAAAGQQPDRRPGGRPARRSRAFSNVPTCVSAVPTRRPRHAPADRNGSARMCYPPVRLDWGTRRRYPVREAVGAGRYAYGDVGEARDEGVAARPSIRSIRLPTSDPALPGLPPPAAAGPGAAGAARGGIGAKRRGPRPWRRAEQRGRPGGAADPEGGRKSSGAVTNGAVYAPCPVTGWRRPDTGTAYRT